MPRDRGGRTISGVMPHRSSTIITAIGINASPLRVRAPARPAVHPWGGVDGVNQQQRKQPVLPRLDAA